MAIIFYLCLLLISGAPASLFAAIPPESVYLHALTPPESAAGAVKLEPRHWCDPTYEGNGALRAILDPLHSESAREYCSTYISASPAVTVTAVAAEVMSPIHHKSCSALSSLFSQN